MTLTQCEMTLSKTSMTLTILRYTSITLT